MRTFLYDSVRVPTTNIALHRVVQLSNTLDDRAFSAYNTTSCCLFCMSIVERDKFQVLLFPSIDWTARGVNKDTNVRKIATKIIDIHKDNKWKNKYTTRISFNNVQISRTKKKLLGNRYREKFSNTRGRKSEKSIKCDRSKVPKIGCLPNIRSVQI